MKVKETLFSILCILAGNLGYAAAVVLFVEPAGFLMGGATGLALFANHLTGVSVSLAVLVLNAFFLAMAYFCLGKQFAAQTLLCSLLCPAALELVDRLAGDLVLTSDPMLSTLMAGALIGISLGIIFRRGSSTGGMDIPPLVLYKYLGIPVSVSIWVSDCVILLLQVFSATSEEILYSILLVVVYTIVLDKTLLMGKSQVQVKVVSQKVDELRSSILSNVGRGVTMLHAKTGYAGRETEMLLSVLSPRELPQMKQLILSIDPNAFVMISQVTEVGGEGFSELKQNL